MGMTDKRRGALWNALGSTMYALNTFLMLALVSRVGTVEDAGCFSIAFTTAQLLYFVGLFGVSHYQMTDYAERFSFSTYKKLRAASCVLMLLCCGAVVRLMGFSGIKRSYTVCLTVLMLLNAVGELYQCLFFQKNRLDLSGSALFYRTLWPLLLFCATALLTKNILLAVAVQLIANLAVTGFYAFRVAPRFLEGSVCHRAEDTPVQLARTCLPLAVSLLLMNVVINMSRYGIELLGDDTDQGYFAMIFLPVQVIYLCSQFLFKPYLNQYSELLQEKKSGEFLQLLGKQSLLLGALTVVCCIGAYLLGAPVLGFIYGKDLSAFALPLMLVVFGGGIYAQSQLLYFILVILRRQKAILMMYTAAVPVSAAVSLGMIHIWGIWGAVLAFSVTYLAILVCCLIVTGWVLRESV